jgi:hypothetical protein
MYIQFRSFYIVISRSTFENLLRVKIRSMRPSKIAVAFKYIDQNGSGTVNKEEINQLLHLDGKISYWFQAQRDQPAPPSEW